jgi:hypothetical protein
MLTLNEDSFAHHRPFVVHNLPHWLSSNGQNYNTENIQSKKKKKQLHLYCKRPTLPDMIE